jgi:paraquat-inducible protein A
LIILAASILIPIFKITGLTIILLSIRLRQKQYIRQQTAMFRLIEFIGRWSMLDIFVVALLGFFVNFGFLSSIETAPGATYFCLVVVTTMFAAIAFDPRLLWDVVNTDTSTGHAVQ